MKQREHMRFSGTFMLLFMLLAALAMGAVSCAPSGREGAGSASAAPVYPRQGELRVAQWNLENLFDADDDPHNEGDDEFTPRSWRRWTDSSYRLKLRHLSEILHLLDADIVCVQEVENRRVLEDLSRTLERLHGRGYPHIVHREGPDHRGIDVAMLSRVAPASARWLTPVAEQRDILAAEFETEGGTLTVLVNHWKSRWGGAEETAPMRAEQARAVRAEVDRILSATPAAAVLVVGDFNDDNDDPSLVEHLGAVLDAGAVLSDPEGRLLFNLHGLLPPEDRGTFFFRKGGSWHTFDAIIATRALLPEAAGAGRWRVAESSVRVCRLPTLLMEDGTPRPFRPFRNPDTGRQDYHDGYSDHLPMLVDLTLITGH